ncbi:MAG: DUF3136 domain-containing protein [Synechococcaceae cyanobacterium]|jgi:hypothetical protein
MSQAALQSPINLDLLDTRYSLYSQAMRFLIRDGRTFEQLQQSICWDRLLSLHQSLPAHYCDPVQLYSLLKQEICV